VAILDELKEIVSEILGVGVEDIQPNASFAEDLGAGSLDLVELVMALEDKFKTKIPDEDASKLKTVQDAMNYLEDRSVLK